MTIIRRRLLGLAFLVVMSMLAGLSVLIYSKAFTDVVRVRVEADQAGNQLQETSDVKIRGLIVGEVRTIEASTDGAVIELAIETRFADQVPGDVLVRLLPKTLFGERYVSLVIPDNSTGEPITDGAVISQDRSATAIELEKVFDDLFPVLEAVAPQDLSVTLGAIAGAIEGRGQALGDNLVRVGEYVGELNPYLPTLQEDLTRLAGVADIYDDVAPDLLAVLDNLSFTSQTLVDQQEQLRRTFATVTTAADDLTGFLTANEGQIISLASTARPVLDLLAQYSPMYTCLLSGLVAFQPLVDEAFGGGAAGSDGRDTGLQLNIEIIPPGGRGAYREGDQPAYLDQSGPHCFGLPDDIPTNGNGNFPQYCAADGSGDGSPGPGCIAISSAPAAGSAQSQGFMSQLTARQLSQNGATDGSVQGLANSAAEFQFVKGVLAVSAGTTPDHVLDLTASLMAPIMRGQQVSLA